MCGICGVIDYKNKIDHSVIHPMLEVIKHRGPDNHGILGGDNFIAGMRRLSIIDIEGGHQPIFNEDQSIFTFFNGEIYNYIELRDKLEKLGHTFISKSDTEVIVHLYEEYGMAFIYQLNGMFGIFLADLNTNEFYIIRDHYGIKPMYYSTQESTFIFASELKSILKSGFVSKEINSEAISNYFNYLYIPSPKTAFNSIQKLEAGHYLKISTKGVEKNKWYSLHDFIIPTSKSRNDLKDEIRYLLENSIALQMRSDVPVGAFLSGGIDSSLITAIASKNTKLPLSTFSVGFTPTEFDELPYARKVSEHYHTNHHELIVSSEDAIKELRNIMWYMDEPIGDSAILPSFLVSKLAVSNVKVSLSGLGGDELFGGYERYKPIKSKLERMHYIPVVVLNSLKPILKNMLPNFTEQVEYYKSSNAEKYHRKVTQMNVDMISRITGTMQNEIYYGDDLMKIYNKYSGSDELNQRMYTDIQMYMNDQLLQLTDRVSMANSLETRVPFLDHRLVELSLSIPSHFKINLKDTKSILKEAVSDLLPNDILYRPKWGFAAPYKTWTLTNAMKELIEQTIDGELVSDGILDKKGVKDFLGNKEMVERYSTWVWPIIALEMWYSNYKQI